MDRMGRLKRRARALAAALAILALTVAAAVVLCASIAGAPPSG